MNFLLVILLELASADEDSPTVTLSRQAVDALIADWLRQAQQISCLRDRLAQKWQG